MSTNKRRSHLHTRALTEGAVMVSLAIVLNFVSRPIFANMVNGGSVTLAMFPILFYAHRWGLGKGVLMGFAYGLLDMLFDGGYAWGWQSILLDYLVAYAALGVGGVLRGRSWGIFPGIVLGCLARFAVHYCSGVTIYKILVPTEVAGFGVFGDPHIYSLVYNGVYMIPNTIIALVIAALLYVPMGKYFAGKDF